MYESEANGQLRSRDTGSLADSEEFRYDAIAKGALSIAIERNSFSALVIKAAITALEKQIAAELKDSVQTVSDLKELASSIKHGLSTLDERVTDKAKLSDELKILGGLLLEEQAGSFPGHDLE